MSSSRLDLLVLQTDSPPLQRGSSGAPKRPFFPLKAAAFGLEEDQSAENEEEKATPFLPLFPHLKLSFCDMKLQMNGLCFA